MEREESKAAVAQAALAFRRELFARGGVTEVVLVGHSRGTDCAAMLCNDPERDAGPGTGGAGGPLSLQPVRLVLVVAVCRTVVAVSAALLLLFNT